MPYRVTVLEKRADGSREPVFCVTRHYERQAYTEAHEWVVESGIPTECLEAKCERVDEEKPCPTT